MDDLVAVWAEARAKLVECWQSEKAWSEDTGKLRRTLWAVWNILTEEQRRAAERAAS